MQASGEPSPNPATLRSIPSVDRVLRDLGATGLPRAVVVDVVRRELAAWRQGRRDDGVPAGSPGDGADVMARIGAALEDLRRSRIQAVINGTGVLIHTNLGRAPLGEAVVRTLAEVAAHYNNLEYDLGGGGRGGGAAYLEHSLALLCAAEAATVVNNNAAALVLVLRHLIGGERPEVVISRGELVQIGGGFRVPEILEASGATLREIGTTNQTSLDDYARAITGRTALVLKVHRSNFYMGGFVDSPTTEALSALCRQRQVPFVEDLGSGATVRTESLPGLDHEPTPAEVLAAGADLVCFSGDKLLGGPQSGIIAGTAALVAALKRHPFFRALRCDKLILSALQTTVDLHLGGESRGVPVLDLMRVPEGELRARAERIVAALGGLPLDASVGRGQGRVGGGTLPRSVFPSVTVELLPKAVSVEALSRALRAGAPSVVGYIADDRLKLDVRTVFPRQDEQLISVIRIAAGRAAERAGEGPVPRDPEAGR